MTKIKNLLFAVSLVFFLALSAFAGYSLSYKNLILPHISVSGINVGGFSAEYAAKKIKLEFEKNPNKLIFLDSEGKEIKTLGTMNVKRDYLWVVNQAVSIGSTRSFFADVKDRFELIFGYKNLTVPVEFAKDDLDGIVDEINTITTIEPKWPKINKEETLFVYVPGINGSKVNVEKLKAEAAERLAYPGDQKILVTTEEIKTDVKPESVKKILENLNSWGEESLQIKYADKVFKKSSVELASLYGVSEQNLNNEKFEQILTEVSEKIETEPKDAIFEFENGRVKEFKQEVVGVKVDRPKFEQLIGQILIDKKEKIVDVPVILSYPKIKAGEINNFGIKELIGVGKSSFGHSIPNRVFNVNLAASRINGVVVAPGEEFSFVKSVGDINRQSGYQTAYVISEGKTVLGDGGGVCQVSTTVFRAAMNFGFPITERKAHAYRVGYYEQDSAPGLDATIYSPTTDFKFLNDSGHHILVQTKVDTKNLTMQVEIYGTNDGRVSSLSKPVVTGQSSAPATSYIDDPNLPKGTTKQIDFAAAGAKVFFDYKVTKGGESLFEKRFTSNYQPWRAVYLVGTRQ